MSVQHPNDVLLLGVVGRIGLQYEEPGSELPMRLNLLSGAFCAQQKLPPEQSCLYNLLLP